MRQALGTRFSALASDRSEAETLFYLDAGQIIGDLIPTCGLEFGFWNYLDIRDSYLGFKTWPSKICRIFCNHEFWHVSCLHISMYWPERKGLRLKSYHYNRPGIYFVTICVHDQFKNSEMFGRIFNKNMILNVCGKIIQDCWKDLPSYYNIILDEFIIMPDHVHGIIKIVDDPDNDIGGRGQFRNGLRPFPTKKNHFTKENTKNISLAICLHRSAYSSFS